METMAFAVWKENYRVGSPAIDGQHQTLFRLVNDLHDAMAKGHGREMMDSILDRLIQYTRTHFREEEAAMLRSGFPGFQAHKAEHEALTAKVLELQKQFRSGNATITLEVMDFLADWLDRHILKSDQQYAPYLAKS